VNGAAFLRVRFAVVPDGATDACLRGVAKTALYRGFVPLLYACCLSATAARGNLFRFFCFAAYGGVH